MPRGLVIDLKALHRLPVSAVLLMAAAVFALGLALTSQYAFGYAPCELCLWQRWPYVVIFACALLAILLRGSKPWDGWLLFFAALAALFGAGVAFFHVGVEQHWWGGLEGCSLHTTAVGTAADRVAQLLAAPVVRCDEISWTFLGLSMASWNIAASFAIHIFALIAANESQNPHAPAS